MKNITKVKGDLTKDNMPIIIFFLEHVYINIYLNIIITHLLKFKLNN